MTSLAQRQNIMTLIGEAVAAGARHARACEVAGLSSRTLQRWQKDSQQGDRRPERLHSPHNAFNDLERERILSVMNSKEYGHLPPSQIVPRLADRGRYVASESTMYRLLRRTGQLKHRSSQRARQPHNRPRSLTACAPNEIYSWDITYLSSSIRGQFYYLYLFLDLFSRKIVGWQVYDTEDSERASELMRDICRREHIRPDQVVLHSDNGGPMKGATMLATLRELGVAPSFSRPAVSDDNPFSESLFRTLKYRPQYPCKPFSSLQAARSWVEHLVRWYNNEHRHSAISFVTPEQRHHGQDKVLLAKRHAVYAAACLRHPERWTGKTRNWSRIDEVHLNPERGGIVLDEQKLELERAA